MIHKEPPTKQGLYDPGYEHDACGMGFVVDLKGRKSHDIIEQALRILVNLRHRGAVGCEENTGDGAGILVQIPHEFFLKECAKLGIELPEPGHYAVGNVFLPTDPDSRRACEEMFEAEARNEGQEVLGWRDVPVDDSMIGPTAKIAEPSFRQVFIKRSADLPDGQGGLGFERKLCIIRKQSIRNIRSSGIQQARCFYISSLSFKTLIYKGMLSSTQLRPFYPDLHDPDFKSALGMVHSRFSTNTFPSWARAHPYRYLCHNGEINTLRGNMNWMQAREGLVLSKLFGKELSKLFPIAEPDCSDSGTFDNVLEFLLMSGRTLQESLMMMIPEAWQ
ncbi:MAG: glutamate synthase subunit alpha, partial [Blastocatellia bacterium]